MNNIIIFIKINKYVIQVFYNNLLLSFSNFDVLLKILVFSI